jgi:hypothetical protein
MSRMVRCALSVITVAGTVLASLGAGADPEVAGVYVSNGVNPDGTSYQGVVHIARHRDSFIVSWMFPRIVGEKPMLERTSVGVGIISGGTLSVSYYSQGLAGVIVYEIDEPGQRLSGRWAVIGDDGTLYTETLTKVPGHVADPVPGPEEPQVRPPAQPPSRRTAPQPLPGGTSL